jgi:predicted dinucleotide-binding enzyme
MKIGIIGSGNVGRTVATHLVNGGHEIAISNSRGPASLEDVVADIGDGARAATIEEAAAFGNVVLEAIPFGEYETLPVDALAGKTVISASNYEPNRDGDVDFDGRTHTELIADHLEDSRVMKAFNTMHYETLRDESRPDADLADRLVVFLAGDDALAKATVADLIEDTGFAPIDMGRLANGRLLEPGARIYDEPMTLTEAESLLEHLTF